MYDTDRRLADERIIEILAKDGLEGPRYDRFEEELARYGLSVLRGWMHSGYIFALLASHGFDLAPRVGELDELTRSSELRDELATMTVARALPVFRERALRQGEWRPGKGASLTTYFVGTCTYEFPNEYRRHQAQRRRWQRAQASLAATAEASVAARSVDVDVLGNLRVAEHLSDISDARTRAAVALRIDGYSLEEIRQLLNADSVRAIEGLLYRWRRKAQQREKGGECD